MTAGRADIFQFVRYCTVGVLNTVVTFAVIYLCKSMLGWNLYLSNALGYLCGITNSFLCNKKWTFRSEGSYRREAVRFGVGAAVCYLVQLVFVWVLTESPFGTMEFVILGITFSGYGLATIAGNVVYTLANFLFNRLITFRG